MGFLEKLKGFLYKAFYGRHGMDQLNLALLVLQLVLGLIAGLFNNKIVYLIFQVLNIAIWAIIILRMFSKNNAKRNSENYKFLRFWNPIQQKLNVFFYKIANSLRPVINRIKDKEHKYFKCTCGTYLRVPKGKGKIKITCSKCGKVMTKKS